MRTLSGCVSLGNFGRSRFSDAGLRLRGGRLVGIAVLAVVRVGVVPVCCSRPRELLRASASDSSAAEGVSGGVRFS